VNYAIIAAGDGERLKQEGLECSKPLLEIDGIPMIERILKTCVKNGASEISIIINETSGDVKKFLENYNMPVKLNLIIKSTPSSLHSLYELGRFVKGAPFLLMTTDSVFQEREFNGYVEFINSRKEYDGVLAVTGFIDDEKPLYVKTNGNLITEFSDSRKDCSLVTGGIYHFSVDIFPVIEMLLNNKVHRLRNFLRKFTEFGGELAAYKFSKIVDVDHLSDIPQALSLLREEVA